MFQCVIHDLQLSCTKALLETRLVTDTVKEGGEEKHRVEIHYEALSDVERYIERDLQLSLEDKRPQYESLLRYVKRFWQIGPETKMLEVGTGTGWFPILCGINGLQCVGLEISPQLIEVSKRLGAHHNYIPDIRLGNIETSDVGENLYDVIIASSVFEHIENWEPALENLYRALKPGGLLFWESSNKFSLTSGECARIPLYGWYPNWLRYRMRIALQGPDIMKLGIDFHQYTYPGLRSHFRKLGFREIHDRVQLVDPSWVTSPRKQKVLALAKRSNLFRHLLLTFFEVTTFVCVK